MITCKCSIGKIGSESPVSKTGAKENFEEIKKNKSSW